MSGITIKLRVWRQAGPSAEGRLVDYTVKDIVPDMSFLEMLDVLNDGLTEQGHEQIAFDSDCREGICGACSLTVNGVPHGRGRGKTTCQLFMRDFQDGSTVTVEPFRATAFPVLKDLITDRSAFDRIMAAGGYVSINTGSAPDANEILIGKEIADKAFDAAACLGCGACVAACKNASASLFVGAKITQLALMPQGAAERNRRALRMVQQMDAEGFGGCTNEAECEAVCPKEISTSHITCLNREFLRGVLQAS